MIKQNYLKNQFWYKHTSINYPWFNPYSFFWNWSKIINKITICSTIYLMIALGYDLFLTLSEMPRISPASLTK